MQKEIFYIFPPQKTIPFKHWLAPVGKLQTFKFTYKKYMWLRHLKAKRFNSGAWNLFKKIQLNKF